VKNRCNYTAAGPAISRDSDESRGTGELPEETVGIWRAASGRSGTLIILGSATDPHTIGRVSSSCMAASVSAPRGGTGWALAGGSTVALVGTFSLGGYLSLSLLPLGTTLAAGWALFGTLAAVAIGVGMFTSLLLWATRSRDNRGTHESRQTALRLVAYGVSAALVPLILIAVTS
jgi:hypothetical protein